MPLAVYGCSHPVLTVFGLWKGNFLERRFLMKRIVVILAALPLLLFVSCGRDRTCEVSVLLTEGNGYTVTSENPVKVPSGSDAAFGIELEPEYSIVQVIGGDADFEDGILTVKGVDYPETLELVAAKDPEKCKFFIERASNGGKISASVDQGWVLSGTKITVACVPDEGVKFVGWSINKPAYSGGEIVSSDPNYTFYLDGNSMLYANFEHPPREDRPDSSHRNPIKEEYSRIVIYNANGGSTAKDGKPMYVDEVSVEIYPMPNSCATPGTFVRDGYVLTEYNTMPDGTGESIGLGHPMTLNTDPDEPTILYCMWAKCSDDSLFETRESGSGLKIIQYFGDEQTVVIPESIQGKAVVAIGANAFVDKKFDTLVLPNTIRTVEKNAVVDCDNLQTLYMFDSLTTIYDESFAGSTKFKTLFLNAAIAPRYTTSGNSFARKWERLVTNADKKRVIVVSGSSTYHGLNSPLLEEILDDEYCVVNYGTHAESNIMLTLDAISEVLQEGDIVVYAPEQLPYVIGSSALTAINFSGWESCYNMFRNVDLSQYTEVFSSYTQYNKVRANMNPLTYSNYASSMSAYAERGFPANTYNSDDFVLGANGTFYFKDGIIPDENAQRLNAVFDDIRAHGATPLVSFPPFNINAADPETLNEDSYQVYNDHIRSVLNAPLISDVADYIFPAKYMLDTDYHLNDYGRDKRTQQLGQDLNRYFKDSGA